LYCFQARYTAPIANITDGIPTAKEIVSDKLIPIFDCCGGDEESVDGIAVVATEPVFDDVVVDVGSVPVRYEIGV